MNLSTKSPRRPAGGQQANGKTVPCMSLGNRIPAKITRRIFFWINRTAQLAQKAVAEALAPLGIEPKHHVVMLLLDETGPLSQQLISASLNLDPTLMVALVDDLEERGLAKRQVDANDRRANAVHLTPKGARLIGEITARLDEMEAQFFGALTKEERAALVAALKKTNGVATNEPGSGE